MSQQDFADGLHEEDEGGECDKADVRIFYCEDLSGWCFFNCGEPGGGRV